MNRDYERAGPPAYTRITSGLPRLCERVSYTASSDTQGSGKRLHLLCRNIFGDDEVCPAQPRIGVTGAVARRSDAGLRLFSLRSNLPG